MIGGSEWKGHRSTDKRYSRDNRLIPPKEFISTAVFGTSMSAHHILGLKSVPRVWLFAILKWYASWVQNVVRQFGPYLPWALDD